MPKKIETPVVYVRQPFAYDSDRVSNDTGIICDIETRTKQEFAEEADINTLVKRYGLMGTMPKDHRVAMFGDFESGPLDYHEAQNTIRAADEAFMSMPPEVRYRFGNNPQSLMEFVSNSENREEVKKLGLLAPEKAAEKPLLVRMDAPPDVPNPTPKSGA